MVSYELATELNTAPTIYRQLNCIHSLQLKKRTPQLLLSLWNILKSEMRHS
jgi:hypothetical protein